MEKDRPEVRLTAEQIAAYRALPPASADELKAIKDETPEQRTAAADEIFKEVIVKTHPLGRRYRYSSLRHPHKN